MEWLALSIALLGTIYFAIHYRGFRRGLMYAVGGVVTLAAMTAIYFWNDNRQTAGRRQIASTLIRPDQIEILDAKLALGVAPQLSGTVINRSSHALAELAVKVAVTDCPNTNPFLLPPGYVLDTAPAPARQSVAGAAPRDARLKKVDFNPFAGDAAVKHPQAGYVLDAAPPAAPKNFFDQFDEPAPAPARQAPDTPEAVAARNAEHEKPWERYKKAQDNAQCGIVGEHVEQVYSINVPAGQKRAFNTSVYLPNLPELKDWSWSYSIEQVIANH
jgi:hypothetical protein